jgi:hypothetical protein
MDIFQRQNGLAEHVHIVMLLESVCTGGMVQQLVKETGTAQVLTDIQMGNMMAGLAVLPHFPQL